MKRKWPDVKVDDFSAAIDFIIKFYQELGWNLVQAIDPRKIKIHPEMWGDIADQLREKWGLSAALGWMNIGPSADEGNVVSGIIKWRDWGCGQKPGLISQEVVHAFLRGTNEGSPAVHQV